jgi:hypothetical protein
MSLIKTRSRRVAAAGTTIVLALVGVGAFAYFSTSGSGTGEAKVANPGETWEISAEPVANLAPGVEKTQKVKIKNTAEGPVSLFNLTAQITGNTQSGTGCQTSWFSVAPASQTFGPPATGQSVPAGGTVEALVTVKMVETAEVNQDACKGATVNLHYAAS